MTRYDPYRLLGLDPGATFEQVRAAFREKVRQRHPDTASGDDGGPNVQEIIEAYRVLSDPQLRDRHDTNRTGSGFVVGGHRVPVRKRGGSGTGSYAGGRYCSNCGGSGELHREAVCPECKGRAEITALDGDRGRVVRCRRCAGTGTVKSSQPCPACSNGERF